MSNFVQTIDFQGYGSVTGMATNKDTAANGCIGSSTVHRCKHRALLMRCVLLIGRKFGK
jgi:hypothetical protein